MTVNLNRKEATVNTKYRKKPVVIEAFKITKHDALLFSLIKWEFFSKRNFKTLLGAKIALVKEYPLLLNLNSMCGMCEGYTCPSCPLNSCGICLCQYQMFSADYVWSDKPTAKNAKVIYNYLLALTEQKEFQS